jgi:hypothetical protein
MPTLVHAPWCDPREHQPAPLECQSEPVAFGDGMAWLAQALDDPEPVVEIDLGSGGRFELTAQAAVVLSDLVRKRPDDMANALELLAGIAGVESASPRTR